MIVLHNSIVDLDCSEYINEEGEGGGGGIMEWRYNGEKLRSSEGYSTSSVLKLHDVSLSNQGDYTCLVAGIVKKLFFVEVVGELCCFDLVSSIEISLPYYILLMLQSMHLSLPFLSV